MVPLPTAQPVNAPPPFNEPFESMVFDQPLVVTQRQLDPAPRYGKIHVITERTSKRYKGMQAAGCLLVVLAFIVPALIGSKDAAAALTAPLFLGGLVLLLVGILQSWWHHG